MYRNLSTGCTPTSVKYGNFFNGVLLAATWLEKDPRFMFGAKLYSGALAKPRNAYLHLVNCTQTCSLILTWYE